MAYYAYDSTANFFSSGLQRLYVHVYQKNGTVKRSYMYVVFEIFSKKELSYGNFMRVNANGI